MPCKDKPRDRGDTPTSRGAPRITSQHQKLGASLGQMLPHSLRRKQPADTLISDLQPPSCETMRCFVAAATGNEYKQHLAKQTERDTKCFHCIWGKNRIIIHSFFYKTMLLPLTWNPFMNPLSTSSARSLRIAMLLPVCAPIRAPPSLFL